MKEGPSHLLVTLCALTWTKPVILTPIFDFLARSTPQSTCLAASASQRPHAEQSPRLQHFRQLSQHLRAVRILRRYGELSNAVKYDAVALCCDYVVGTVRQWGTWLNCVFREHKPTRRWRFWRLNKYWKIKKQLSRLKIKIEYHQTPINFSTKDIRHLPIECDWLVKLMILSG